MSHPLLYGTLSNRRAVALALSGALITLAGVYAFAGPAPSVTWTWWPKAALGAAFYMPLTINGWIDARRHVLVKNFTHLAAAMWLAGVVFVRPPWHSLLMALVVAVPMVGTSYLSGGRLLGKGDARLIAVLAMWNCLWHPWGALTMITLAFLGHAVYVTGRFVARRANLTSRHALGPWLVMGSWLTFVLL